MSSLEHQRTYFRRLAGHYADGYRISLPFLRRVGAGLSPHVRGDVLDVGNGGLATWELRRARTVCFADLCSEALHAPMTLADGTLCAVPSGQAGPWRVTANVLSLPFAAASFDVVVMSYVAHHLSVGSRRGSLANVRLAFAEVHRVLRPHGTFLLVENVPALPCKLVLDGAFPLWFWLLLRVGKPLPYFLSARQLERLVAGGFAIERSERIAWCPRVHQPLFPRWSPPGWLWERLLSNRLFVLRRR